MKIRGICDSCGHKRFFIRKRNYYIIHIKQTATSKGLLCGQCFKKLKKMLNG